jgi:hypothetical protein
MNWQVRTAHPPRIGRAGVKEDILVAQCSGMPAVGNHGRSGQRLSIAAKGSNVTTGTAAYSAISGIFRAAKAQITTRKLENAGRS